MPEREPHGGSPLTIYHVTSAERAAAIQRDGLIDAEDYYGLTRPQRGVWVSDEPLGPNEGVLEQDTFAAEVDAQILEPYEVIEALKGYREWCVPADVLNQLDWRSMGTRDDLEWGQVEEVRDVLGGSTSGQTKVDPP
jgi:hypothetical protein